MLTALTQHAALRILMGRALWLLVLLTIVMTAVRVDSPVGVVLLVAILGWIDVQRRRESLFWANLGYSVWMTTGVFAAVAACGATVFATTLSPLLRSVLPHAR